MTTGPVVSLRELNRWTLARQMPLERVETDAATAIERRGGMQAQYSPRRTSACGHAPPRLRARGAPPAEADPGTALRTVPGAYLRAFGPASRADIAQWLGQPGVVAPALAALETATFQSRGPST